MSRSSVLEYRKEVTETIAGDTGDKFCKEAQRSDAKLIVHFDGKIMKQYMGGVKQLVESLVFLVSSPRLRREVFMFAAPLFDLTCYNTALVIFNNLVAKGLTNVVTGIVADTPSVNWGAEEGVVYHLYRMLERPLLLLQCVHHTEVNIPAPSVRPKNQGGFLQTNAASIWIYSTCLHCCGDSDLF